MLKIVYFVYCFLSQKRYNIIKQNERGKQIMKYYVISYENGETRYGEFADYTSALNYAESRNGGYEFTIEEYDSENDYFC